MSEILCNMDMFRILVPANVSLFVSWTVGQLQVHSEPRLLLQAQHRRLFWICLPEKSGRLLYRLLRQRHSPQLRNVRFRVLHISPRYLHSFKN